MSWRLQKNPTTHIGTVRNSWLRLTTGKWSFFNYVILTKFCPLLTTYLSNHVYFRDFLYAVEKKVRLLFPVPVYHLSTSPYQRSLWRSGKWTKRWINSASCPPSKQSYEIKSPPWTILWFRILGIFSGDHSYITSSYFWTFLPPYVSMFLVLRISKNWRFLTPLPRYKCWRNIWMVP